MKNLFAILLILSSGGVFYYITVPMYEEVQTLRTKKAEYDKALNSSEEAQKVRVALETKYNSIPAENFERLERFLPNNIDNIRLIIEIDKIAGRYGMTISNAQVSVSKEMAQQEESESVVVVESVAYGIGKLSFSVSGVYEDYLSFIKDLEQSLRLINITSISLSAEKSSKDPKVVGDVYEYKTSFDTYWLKQ